MSDLFMKTSKVLRDNIVTDLQKENDFLKNTFHNFSNQIIGCKVKVLQFVIDPSGTIQPECIGKLLKIDNHRAVVVIKNIDNKIKIINCCFRNIEIIDEKIIKLFD